MFNLATKRSAYYERDMTSDIKQLAQETYLEEFDEYNINLMAKNMLVNSVAFQMMERMNLDPKSYFGAIDFGEITYFNAASLSSVLATTMNEISANFVADLNKEIEFDKTRQKYVQNTMDNDLEMVYNKDVENKTNNTSSIDEGGSIDGSNHISRDQLRSGEWNLQPTHQRDIIRKDGRDIHHGESSADSEFKGTEYETTGSGDIRSGEEAIFRREQISQLLSDDYRGNAPDSSIGSGTASATVTRDGDTKNDEAARRERDVEATRSNEMGGDDEQHQAFNRRDHLQGTRSYIGYADQLTLFPTEIEQIEIIDETVERESTVFSISQADIDDELIRGSGFQDGKERIAAFFSNDPTKKRPLSF